MKLDSHYIGVHVTDGRYHLDQLRYALQATTDTALNWTIHRWDGDSPVYSLMLHGTCRKAELPWVMRIVEGVLVATNAKYRTFGVNPKTGAEDSRYRPGGIPDRIFRAVAAE